MTDNDEWVVAKVTATWVTRRREVYGMLELTQEVLRFREGAFILGAVVWEMPLDELSNVLWVEGRIEVYSAGYYVARFGVGTEDVKGAALAEAARARVFAVNPEAGAISHVQARGLEPLETVMTKVEREEDALDQALLAVLEAFRHSQVIAYEQILEIVNEEHDVTRDLVQLRLAQLIDEGRLPGFLDKAGYRRDTFVSVQCQLCDGVEENPHQYWQCPECQRFVCAECRGQTAWCPGHPQTPVRLVRLPIRCENCQKAVVNLSVVPEGRCPQCETPFPPF